MTLIYVNDNVTNVTNVTNVKGVRDLEIKAVIRVSAETRDKLKCIAAKERISISELAEDLLGGFLDEISDDFLSGYVDFCENREIKKDKKDNNI